MLPFFRKKRWRLAKDNQFFKYSRYAIGEIVLVVIGILIALSINNWNEFRKDRVIEQKYLEAIKGDLEKDIEQAELIIEMCRVPLNVLNNIYPKFNLDTNLKVKNIDTTSLEFIGLFRRTNSFRSTKGTYSSLISDGKSNLIKNKVLFQQIQSIYDTQQVRIFSIYDDFKTRENDLTSDFSYEKYHWNYNLLKNNKNLKLIAALANFWDSAQFYCIYMNSLIDEMKKVIDYIDKELMK